jgi:PAS domain S-box-containing protein
MHLRAPHPTPPADSLLHMLDGVTDAVVTLNPDWRITYVNSSAEKLLHTRREDLLGTVLWEKYPEFAGSPFQTECLRAVTEGVALSFEAYHAPWAAWFEVDARPSAEGLMIFCRDRTEWHETLARLQEESQTLAAIANASTDALICLDREGRIMRFNPAAERMFGRIEQSMLGQQLDQLLPERYRSEHARRLHTLDGAGVESRMMGLGSVKGLHADGTELDLESTITVLHNMPSQKRIASLRDVSEQARRTAESKQAQDQMADLNLRLVLQEKALVTRLARALHDQLGQTIAAIHMAHETLGSLHQEDTPAAAVRLHARMGNLVTQAMRQVRHVLVDLRPPLLEEYGLASALDNELRNRALTQPLIGISIDVPADLAAVRWPADVEYALFMVAREAIENALRHSGASELSVHMAGSADALLLEVVDNGSGIPGTAKTKPGHLGMLGMRERARAVAATVTVAPREGGGTCVTIGWEDPAKEQP